MFVLNFKLVSLICLNTLFIIFISSVCFAIASDLFHSWINNTKQFLDSQRCSSIWKDLTPEIVLLWFFLYNCTRYPCKLNRCSCLTPYQNVYFPLRLVKFGLQFIFEQERIFQFIFCTFKYSLQF